MTANGRNDLDKIDFKKKPNFLVSQNQQMIQSSMKDSADQTRASLNNSISKGSIARCRSQCSYIDLNIRLRETSQERILRNHEQYCTQWQKQEDKRDDRVTNYLTAMVHEPYKDCLKGLAGTQMKRAKLIKSTTGRFCGSIQRRSILSYESELNQVKAARETVAISRHYDREKLS